MKKFLFLLLFFPMQVLAADAMPMADVFRHPIVEGLLSAVILISLLAEIKTAGFSGGALAAAIAGCLLIGANWSEGDQMLEAVLYFGGLALVILDILALMTGVAAVIGLVLLLSGLFFTFGGDMTALYILSGAYFSPGSVSISWSITFHKAGCGRKSHCMIPSPVRRASSLPPLICQPMPGKRG